MLALSFRYSISSDRFLATACDCSPVGTRDLSPSFSSVFRFRFSNSLISLVKMTPNCPLLIQGASGLFSMSATEKRVSSCSQGGTSISLTRQLGRGIRNLNRRPFSSSTAKQSLSRAESNPKSTSCSPPSVRNCFSWASSSKMGPQHTSPIRAQVQLKAYRSWPFLKLTTITLNLQRSSFLQSSSEQVSDRPLLSFKAYSTLSRVSRACSQWLSLYSEKALRMSKSLASRQPTGTARVTASSMRLMTSEQFSQRMASMSLPLGPASSNLPSMKQQTCLMASVGAQLSRISEYLFSCMRNKILTSQYLLTLQMLVQAAQGSPVSSSHLAFSIMDSQWASSMEMAVVNSRMACSKFLSSMKMTPLVQKYLATLSSDFQIARSMSSRDSEFMPRQRQMTALQKYKWAFSPVLSPCSMSSRIFTKPSVLMGSFRYSSLRMTAVQKKGQGRRMKPEAFSNFWRASCLSPLRQCRMPSQMQMLQEAATESVLGSS